MTILSRALKGAIDTSVGLSPAYYVWDANIISSLYADGLETTPTPNTDGAAVGAWAHTGTSPIAATVRQTTVGEEPSLAKGVANGLDMVNFNGTDEHLHRVAATGDFFNAFEWSMFMVFEHVGTIVDADGIFQMGVGNQAGWQSKNGMAIGAYVTDKVQLTSSANTPADPFDYESATLSAGAHLLEVHWTNTEAAMWIDGAYVTPVDDVAGANGNQSLCDTFLFGASAGWLGLQGTLSNYWPGRIGEIRIYDYLMGTDEIERNRTILMNKWMADSANYWALS